MGSFSVYSFILIRVKEKKLPPWGVMLPGLIGTPYWHTSQIDENLTYLHLADAFIQSVFQERALQRV